MNLAHSSCDVKSNGPPGTAVQTLSCQHLLDDGRLDGPFAVSVVGGVVTALERRGPRAGDRVLDGGVLTAGMTDLQLNGAAGIDLAGADADGWATLAEHEAHHGVTAFCPAFITAPLADLVAALTATAAAAGRLAGLPVAQPAGAHLEGPFLSAGFPGAHPVDLMRAPVPEAVDALLAGSPAIVTLAPELPGATEAITRLRAAGVAVSVGHSGATAAETAAAADAGASLVTHLFNAQRPFTHREPGVAGRALVDDRLVCGLIADLHHVAPDAVRLAFAAAPGRIALVSDAMAAAGMPAGGTYPHGPIEAVGRGHEPPALADGTFAGSALHLDEAVRNVVGLGVPRAAALAAATSVPARAIGRSGAVRPGERADLVWWDDELRVRAVWIGGAQVTV
jgi:N-acetylglucosamine-6-phosphate deacetylase